MWEAADGSATQELLNRNVSATRVLIFRESLSSTEREHVLNLLSGQFMNIKDASFPAHS